VDLRIEEGPRSKILVVTPKDVVDWLSSIQINADCPFDDGKKMDKK